jgi:hypothetical protein
MSIKSVARVRFLLDKYYQGSSTVEEEELLKDFFSSNKQIPEDLLADQHFFIALQYQSEITPSIYQEKEISREKSKSKLSKKGQKIKVYKLLTTWTVAASIFVVIGFGFFFSQKSKEIIFADTYSDPYLAMEQTQNILALVGSKISMIQTEMQPLAKISIASQIVEPVEELTRSLKHIDKINALTKPKEIPFISHIFEEGLNENEFEN